MPPQSAGPSENLNRAGHVEAAKPKAAEPEKPAPVQITEFKPKTAKKKPAAKTARKK